MHQGFTRLYTFSNASVAPYRFTATMEGFPLASVPALKLQEGVNRDDINAGDIVSSWLAALDNRPRMVCPQISPISSLKTPGGAILSAFHGT